MLQLKWLNRTSISTKMRVSFSALVIMAFLLSLIGLSNMQRIDKSYTAGIDEQTEKIIETTNAMLLFNQLRVQLYELLQNSNNQTQTDAILQDIHKTQGLVNETAQRYASYLTSDYETEAFNQNGVTIGKCFEKLAEMESLVLENKVVQAHRIFDEEVSSLIDNIVQAMNLANDIAIEDLSTISVENTKTTSNTLILSLILITIAIVAAILMALLITFSINGPMNVLLSASKAIANGNLSVNLRTNGRDEISVLSNQFAHVVEIFRDLAKEINVMSEAIEGEGDVEARIHETQFEGDYKKIANGINVVIGGLTRDTLELIGCLSKYAEGDFNAQITRYVGKKAILNDVVDGLQNNLKSVVSDINRLTKAANEGDLSMRMDENKYKNDWQDLARGLNNVLVGVIIPLDETIEILEDMSRGDLSVSIKGDYKGQFLRMKTAVNKMLQTLSSYVNGISEVLNEMAEENFDIQINTDYIGDFAAIKNSLTNIIYKLSLVLGSVNNTADEVSHGARLISSSNQILSNEISEQVNTVHELVDTISTITEQTAKNSQNANNANQLAVETKEKAIASNAEMKNMLESMEAINKSSDDISKIIKVIEDIAFQTNLLALNAAVEAARAGEHGKGFAVVADEVRNLANRSQDAASETASLIQGSILKVSEGRVIADQTAGKLTEMVAQINDISVLINDVANSSNTQEQAIHDLNNGINKISAITKDNAQTVLEETQRAQDMNNKAELFKTLVSTFKLGSA